MKELPPTLHDWFRAPDLYRVGEYVQVCGFGERGHGFRYRVVATDGHNVELRRNDGWRRAWAWLLWQRASFLAKREARRRHP